MDRSFDNLEAWQQSVGDQVGSALEEMKRRQVLVRFVLFLDLNEQVMEARLLERGKSSGRADDNVEPGSLEIERCGKVRYCR